MNNTEDGPGDDLRQQAVKETATAIARMKTGAAFVAGSDINSAIKHIAAATQKPVDLPGLPVIADDGTFQRPVDVHFVYLRKREDFGNAREKHSLLRRVLNWLGC